MTPEDAKDRFRDLLELRGSRPPLDEMCLLICCMAGYDVDIAAEQRALDFASAQLTPTFEGIMSELFRSGELRGNEDSYFSLSNSMLSEVRRTGLGIPITLSVMAMEHARRVGVEVLGIGLPGHFIVRSGDDEDLFADPFHRGTLMDRGDVRRLFARTTGERAHWRESYMLPVTERDILQRILNNIRGVCLNGIRDRRHMPWVLELLSLFPYGSLDDVALRRAMAPFN
jgi:regulator of sirC expression with transglutaminase-like and TPR domain